MKASLHHYATWGNGPRLNQIAEIEPEPCEGGDQCDDAGFHVLVIEVPPTMTRDEAIEWVRAGGDTPA